MSSWKFNLTLEPKFTYQHEEPKELWNRHELAPRQVGNLLGSYIESTGFSVDSYLSRSASVIDSRLPGPAPLGGRIDAFNNVCDLAGNPTGLELNPLGMITPKLY